MPQRIFQAAFVKPFAVLATAFLLVLASCGLIPPYYHFEQLGGFKFPPSFHEFYLGGEGSIQVLHGEMAPADAKRIVDGSTKFQQATTNVMLNVAIPGHPGLIPTRDEPMLHDAATMYVLRARDERRVALFFLDIETGEFQGSVTFI